MVEGGGSGEVVMVAGSGEVNKNRKVVEISHGR